MKKLAIFFSLVIFVFSFSQAQTTIYCIGGQNGVPVATNYAYNTINNTWTTEAPMPAALSNVGVASVENIIYCIGGGNNAGNDVATTYAYNTINNTWATEAPVPSAVNDGAVVS